jgi:HEAT repeat protein
MFTTPTCRRAVSAAASIGALIFLTDTSIAADAEDDWALMEDALLILATGDPAAKREAAEEASGVFDILAYDSDHDEEDVAKVIASLRSLVRVERDDWISYRLLGGLAEIDLDALQPLFLDALKDPSPNLRWRGARWFTGHTDPEALPELDDAWRHEERPWVQADLMIALVRHGSRDRSDEFLRLARGKDATLAPAAVRALALIGDPQAIPFLETLARTSRSNTGLLALDALALWPDSRDALETVIEATRSPRLDFQRHAAAALESFEDPAASARLFSIASGRGDLDVRAAALGALKQADLAALVPLTLGILREAPTPENAPLHSAAIGVLRHLDDPSVLPALASLEFKSDDSRFHELFWLRRFLSREREPGGAKRQPPPREKKEFDFDPEEEATEKVVLTPPPSTLTLRCWNAPDVPGDPREFPRLPGGSEVGILDHFEHGETSWVQIETRECWVPGSFTDTSHPASPFSGKKETSMTIRREFDLPADEVESDVAQGLMDAGLLEVIEPGDEVMGVAVIIDPEDFDQVFLLARSCGLDETMLDGEIYDIVSDLAPLHSGHPALERFRRAVAAQRGDTDELLDLDIEELTDH